MPKSFLMGGRKRKTGETLDNEGMDEHDVSDSSESSCPNSPKSFRGDSDHDDDRLGRHVTSPGQYERLSPPSAHPSSFALSADSPFSKIEKPGADAGTSSHATPLFPGFYPSLYNYSIPTTGATVPARDLGTFGIPYTFPQLALPNLHSDHCESNNTDSPDKNMYYYVDHRIPFTNYFMNLTKLLSGNSKECTATTPLVKIDGDDSRADDRDKSALSSPEYEKCRTHETPEHETHSPVNLSNDEIDDEITDTNDPQDCSSQAMYDKMRLPVLPATHFLNPYSNPMLQTPNAPSLLSLPGRGIYHPALMQIHGAGFRRFNQEKPPPVKKYRCDVCGKAFSRSNTLVTHKRIHTGDKPFKCEICDRAFRQPGNLTRHRLTHTTAKPYVCHTCGKAFNRASNLHTHMRIHTHVKAFVCPYCDKAFHQKIDMEIHCYTHTGRHEVPPM